MNREAYVVIGANYGDEGKGLMTDYFASKFGEDCCVVKFNGTAQAGHTVLTPYENIEHIFSHFGSGTFVGARTHFASTFFIHPIKYRQEYTELSCKITPPYLVTCDGGCNVITPYDMFLNDLEESLRDERHGSTGMGFHEAIKRSRYLPITVNDLRFKKALRARLFEIKERTLCVLKHRHGEQDFSEHPVFSDDVLERFEEDCNFFIDTISHITNSKSRLGVKNYIFEGGQGLLLDQNYGSMPHCTPSNCGLKNVIRYLDSSGISSDIDLSVVYVTRSYLTRHGNGPLLAETDLGFSDPTNKTNMYQGNFRYGLLGESQKNMRHINADFYKHCRSGDKLLVAMTHLDQHTDDIAETIKAKASYRSYGRTRSEVEHCRL